MPVLPRRAALAQCRLHIGHRRASGLRKADLRPQHQGTQAQVGQGQHDIEIFVHVAVVQQVMVVEAVKDSGHFQPSGFGQVHAPVNALVHGIVGGDGDGSTGDDAP